MAGLPERSISVKSFLQEKSAETSKQREEKKKKRQMITRRTT
jgi:hypothetical protein